MLSKAAQIACKYVSDIPLIDFSLANVPGFDKFAQPSCGKRIVLVVIGHHALALDDVAALLDGVFHECEIKGLRRTRPKGGVTIRGVGFKETGHNRPVTAVISRSAENQSVAEAPA